MDLELEENGDGGELIKKANDLSVINGFQNMMYLGMFGGNVNQSTPSSRISTEQNFDYWGNSLLDPGDDSVQFNSQTERALKSIPLTSAGRVLIQQAVQNDLKFMEEFATVVIAVTIEATDKLAIGVRLIQPDNLEKQDFIFIWNSTRQELMSSEEFTVVFSPLTTGFFDFSFDVFFG
jgi:hypothetical protein